MSLRKKGYAHMLFFDLYIIEPVVIDMKPFIRASIGMNIDCVDKGYSVSHISRSLVSRICDNALRTLLWYRQDPVLELAGALAFIMENTLIFPHRVYQDSHAETCPWRACKQIHRCYFSG